MQREMHTFLSDVLTGIDTYTRVIFLVIDDEQTCPVLFFARCFAALATHKSALRLNLELHEEQYIYQELETTFLGLERTIWIQGLSSLTDRKLQQWLTYFQQYTGPHTLICVIKQEHMPVTVMDYVTIPAMLTRRECTLLYTFLAQRSLTPIEHERITAIFNHHEKIDVDTCCMLFEYMRLVGRDADEFMQDWLARLVTAQSSLFALSQHLFSRSLVLFMKQWTLLQPLYSDQFWVAFWSEQFWRASWYIFYMRTKQVQQAKKIGFRLPFSFLQKDYRTYTQQEMAQFLSHVYELDIALKKGSSSGMIDLLLYRFFAV